jgi:hypothetical protein
MTHDDWAPHEVEAIVADYFAMWEKELRGENVNKAEHNRALRNQIPARSRGSIEKKHQNISAVLWHIGYPYIDGYKPLPKYQRLLRNVVESRLAKSSILNELVAKRVQAEVKFVPPVRNLKAIRVAPPSRKEVKTLVADETRRRTRFVRRNYLEAEALNCSLGFAGENFILDYEHERLWRAGKRNLADKVEHVSATRGDYLGFDILSFETNGRERLIEVKTTRFGSLSRFFASSNEVEFSDSHKNEYFLYRLFRFDKQPKFFILAGSLRESCQLKAVNFSAVPN